MEFAAAKCRKHARKGWDSCVARVVPLQTPISDSMAPVVLARKEHKTRDSGTPRTRKAFFVPWSNPSE